MAMLDRAKDLKGYALNGRDGQMGSVKEFLFDDQHWGVRYLVADTGGWLTGRQVLISPYALHAVNRAARTIAVDLTRQQITDSPSLSSHEPVSRQFEETYYGYFGWPVYWMGPYLWGMSPSIEPDRTLSPITDPTAKARDSHLRSTDDVTGHHLRAADGEIGHVADFIVDEDAWAIRYLVVDTQNWWPGRKVLVSPRWIERISWSDATVVVGLTREAIRQSPEYTDKSLLTRDDETRLHQHYGQKGYWIDESAAATTPADAGTRSKPQ